LVEPVVRGWASDPRRRRRLMIARSTTKRRGAGRLLLLAALAVSVVLLAVPALASAANNTTLTAKASASTITWGGNVILTGTLMDTTTITALGDQWVWVQWRLTNVAPWNDLAEVTTDDAQYATGQYTAVAYPTELTYYRMNFLGTAAYNSSISNTLQIRVRPALGVPKVPRAARAGRYFTVWGTLKPRFPAGAQTVKLTAYRYRNGKWVKAKSYRATNANSGAYTRYSARIRISKTGRYRFKASTAATTTAPIFSSATPRYSPAFRVR
jgi:hypothetical protein